MRWTPGGTSDDIEDRRDEDGGGGGPVFGGFGPHLRHRRHSGAARVELRVQTKLLYLGGASPQRVLPGKIHIPAARSRPRRKDRGPFCVVRPRRCATHMGKVAASGGRAI